MRLLNRIFLLKLNEKIKMRDAPAAASNCKACFMSSIGGIIPLLEIRFFVSVSSFPSLRYNTHMQK